MTEAPATSPPDSATAGAGAPAARPKRRGRETATDMIRSLAVVMVLVVMMWFFGQAPKSSEVQVRVIDPTATLSTFQRLAPTAPLPAGLSERWRATSATLTPGPDRVRVGYVTPGEQYAEYAATTGPAPDFVREIVGEVPPAGTIDVAGVTWQRYLGERDAISLVRTTGPVTVVVGSLRASASLEEITELARSLRTR